VSTAIKEELDEAEDSGLGLAADDAPTLKGVMERAPSAEDVLRRPDVTLDELLTR
jgi:hypothetical protein